jgi:adenylosuccinate lyase
LSSEAISPVDGRYRGEVKELARYLSEEAFFRARFKVELEYLSLLSRLGIAPRRRVPALSLSVEKVRSVERRVGHDVKALEVYIREELKRSGASELSPFVHLGLTSEDTNSIAFARLLSSAIRTVVVPAYASLSLSLARIAGRESRTAMLARTHGRPAVPTTFGKEMGIFAYRIAERTFVLGSLRPVAKLSGAVGTYASFRLLADLDWQKELGDFVRGMGLDYAPYTTQVAPGERLSDILHLVMNVNQLMLGLCRDLWMYQMLGYVTFTRGRKVSSSTMPQKVNPVDLENAEGQAELSNALLSTIGYKLQTTRLQRDLSDSVLRRAVGQAIAHSLIACKRVSSSLSSMTVERNVMSQDIARHPEVFSEAVQVLMRAAGDERGYEKVRRAVERGKFEIPEDYRERIGDYLGDAPSLAEQSRLDVERLLSPLKSGARINF